MYSCNILYSYHNFSFPDIAEGKDSFTKLDIYVILSGILDGSKFHEFKAYYGTQAIAGTGVIEGRRVGIVANIGDVGIKEALKISHFVNSCSRRRLPILFIQNSHLHEDMPNEKYDEETEMGLLKCRGSLASLISTCNVPKVALTISALSQDGLLTMVLNKE